MKPWFAAAGLWALVIVGIVLLAQGYGRAELMHAYLAAWLVLVSLPLGALVALMGLEVLEQTDAAIAGPLRLLLAMLPIMALLFIPILFDLDAAYTWPTSHDGLAAHWFEPFWFGVRAVSAFVAWIGLSLYFLRPARPSLQRRTLASLGLLAHLFIGTIIAYDWYMALDTGFVSSVYGLVVISSQGVLALTVALGIGQIGDATAPPRRAVVLALLVALLAAIDVQFSQYLVIWSANLPKEIVWYQTRWQDLAGPSLVYGGPILIVLAGTALAMPVFGSRRPIAMASLAALVVVETLDLIALASPRDTFTLPVLSVVGLFLIAIAGLAAAFVTLFGRNRIQQVRHG